MRHFFTAEIELAEYGRVMLVGDQEAVERLIAMLASQDGHFKLLPPEA